MNAMRRRWILMVLVFAVGGFLGCDSSDGILSPSSEITQSQIEAGSPMKRIGRPADMAGVALYLASPASAFVTGAVIPVDGGLRLAQRAPAMPIPE